jgi:hypothetical protein
MPDLSLLPITKESNLFLRSITMKKLVLPFFLIAISFWPGYAQDTLPKFSVRNVGNNRIIIGWTNPFQSIRQLSIQRSFDSLGQFKTILTVPDPTTPQNGYVDTKANNDHMYYRLYILLDKGFYLFSDPKKPFIDTTAQKLSFGNGKLDKTGNPLDPVGNPNFGINNGNKPNLFKPSMHVYTHADGFVRINLPEDEENKYSLKFFDDNETFLFELKDIKTRSFKIDKANFYHAGWFRFELFENDKLIEKHKFYLEKDF